MRKGPECAYDKWNICEVICDTDIRNGQPSHGGDHKVLKVLKWWLLKGTLITSTVYTLWFVSYLKQELVFLSPVSPHK